MHLEISLFFQISAVLLCERLRFDNFNLLITNRGREQSDFAKYYYKVKLEKFEWGREHPVARILIINLHSNNSEIELPICTL